MNKLIPWLLLLCALLMLPLSASAETMEADTADTLQACLMQCREEGLAEFKIQCSKDLYNEVKADGNAPLYRLCYLAGMKEFSLRADRNGKLSFTGVTYGSPYVAECATLEEVQAAAASFIQQGADSMTVICANHELFQELYSYGVMETLFVKLGVEGYRRQANTSDVFFITDMARFAVPYATVSNVSEAGEKVARWKEENVPAFNLVFGEETFNALSRDDYRLIAFLGGAEDYSLSYNLSSGILYFTEVKYTDVPGIYCTSEEELVAAIRAMGANGHKAFQFMLDETTYEKVYEGYFNRLYELHAEAGLVDCDLRYSGVSNMLLYDNAVINADATILSSLAEVIAHVEGCAARGDKDIFLLIAKDVYDDLMDGVNAYFVSDAKFYDLIANAGIANAGNINFNRSSGVINMKDVQYYAGINILRALENGDTSVLTDREQQALTAARLMAEDCLRDDQTATALAIHDKLCALITYTDDSTTDEDDCCIGALLDGKANCDGYADAMLLVGKLAGLNVRFQHGDSLKGGLGSLFSTHMWNMIELDGSWRMIDVTWDDSGEGSYALWFNIGEDRASRSHVWSHEMTVPMLAVTDTTKRPVAEYFAANEDEITSAAAAAQAADQSVFDIYVSPDSGLGMITSREAALRGVSCSIRYSWIDSLFCLHVELMP